MKKILSIQQHEQEAWLKEIASPTTPSTGYVAIYAKSDGKVYRKDDAGVETELGGAGGSDPLDAITTWTPTGDNQTYTAVLSDEVITVDGGGWTGLEVDITACRVAGKKVAINSRGINPITVVTVAPSAQSVVTIYYLTGALCISDGTIFYLLSTSYDLGGFVSGYLGAYQQTSEKNQLGGYAGIEPALLTTARLWSNGGYGYVNPENQLNGEHARLVPPTVTNDDTEFYAIGDKWIDIHSRNVYLAEDVTTGAAIWTKIASAPVSMGQATLDFGADTQESTNATVVVTPTELYNLDSTSIITVTISGLPTGNHDSSDYGVEQISAYGANIVNNTSFEIIGFAPNGTWGEYLVNWTVTKA